MNLDMLTDLIVIVRNPDGRLVTRREPVRALKLR